MTPTRRRRPRPLPVTAWFTSRTESEPGRNEASASACAWSPGQHALDGCPADPDPRAADDGGFVGAEAPRIAQHAALDAGDAPAGQLLGHGVERGASQRWIASAAATQDQVAGGSSRPRRGVGRTARCGSARCCPGARCCRGGEHLQLDAGSISTEPRRLKSTWPVARSSTRMPTNAAQHRAVNDTKSAPPAGPGYVRDRDCRQPVRALRSRLARPVHWPCWLEARWCCRAKSEPRRW